MPCATAFRRMCTSSSERPFEDRAVELGLGAVDDELDLLARLDREIADGARERADDRRQRQRPHPDRGVLQAVEQAPAGVELVGDQALRPAGAVLAERMLEAP